MFKNTPPVTRHLLIITFIIFLLQLVFEQRGSDLADTFGLHFFLADDFRVWQLVTYMFLHGSWEHILMNMFSFWMFARIIEQTMSSKRFLIYYMVCGVGAALCQEFWQLGEYYLTGLASVDFVRFSDGTLLPVSEYLNNLATVGASGAVYGILLAFGVTFPNERIMLLIPPIPMKAKYFVCAFAVIELVAAFASNGNVAHFAHLGGMLFGWFLIRHWRRKQQRGSGFTTWEEWNPNKPSRWQQFRAWLKRLFGRRTTPPPPPRPKQGRESDYDYNAQRKANEDRIDEILDKVKRSGYESLSESEKRELFDRSHR